ncbi:MAG TPA: DUF4145 domain-containing protein [Sedimentisphaerales bacterium]|nr:DUF4145 domain-containing protein [Sedimentisphaerales bacterium]
MTAQTVKTFIIDCPWCKAKVAAIEHGRARQAGRSYEDGEPYGNILAVGECPSCHSLLAGESHQVDFEGWDAAEDRWSDIVRIYPKPPRTFLSYRIPNSVRDSIGEADKSLQANANIAACVMLGRALEAICRDLLEQPSSPSPAAGAKPRPKRPIMLGEGIRQLKDKGLIDDRLLDWSQQLHAFRNVAAHPTDEPISREDAEDLQSFVYAIIEYIYDLTDRYTEFKERIAKKAKKK